MEFESIATLRRIVQFMVYVGFLIIFPFPRTDALSTKLPSLWQSAPVSPFEQLTIVPSFLPQIPLEYPSSRIHGGFDLPLIGKLKKFFKSMCALGFRYYCKKESNDLKLIHEKHVYYPVLVSSEIHNDGEEATPHWSPAPRLGPNPLYPTQFPSSGMNEFQPKPFNTRVHHRGPPRDLPTAVGHPSAGTNFGYPENNFRPIAGYAPRNVEEEINRPSMPGPEQRVPREVLNEQRMMSRSDEDGNYDESDDLIKTTTESSEQTAEWEFVGVGNLQPYTEGTEPTGIITTPAAVIGIF